MATSGIDQSLAITNDSGTDVVVLDAYNSATNVASNSPQQGYNQTLKALPLTAGGTVLANGATGTVTLNDTRIDPKTKQPLPNYLYQLLISDARSLFPVLNAGVALDFATMGYPPVTATAAAAKNMQTALAFHQNIMAYPGSKLAKDFVTALNQAQQQSTPDAMMKAMAAYFNTTKGFQGLDFPSYMAVSTYLQAFAWTWGLGSGNTPGRTYWLYASSDAQGGSSGGSPSSQGKIVFSGGASGTGDPTDPDSGYTIKLSPASGSDVTLYFSSGQLVNDRNADVPSIALQGTFGLKSTFTQQASDNVLWPIFVGTIDGKQVIGVSQEPEDAFVKWLKSLLPKSFNDVINDFLKVMGVVMAIDFIKTKLQAKSNKAADQRTNENQGRDPDAQQRQQADADANQVGENARAQQQDVADRLGNGDGGQPRVQVPEQDAVPNAQVDANEAQVRGLNEMTGDMYQGSINEYDGQLKQLAEIEVNPQLEDAMGKLVDANDSLSAARSSGDFSDVSSSLVEVKTSINVAVESMDVPQQVQEQLKESQQISEEYEKTAEENNATSDDVSGGDEEFPGEE